ncbi:MAG TPA: MFS transporter [Magnetospirillaceae bacterium]|nr:MFS transporter [Magnetospirillaceae bacterium]
MGKQTAGTHVGDITNKHRGVALFVVSLAFVMDLLDVTIVNIALPSIQTSLGASFATMQWLVAGYILTFAVLLITGGRMGDVFGYKKLFLGGIAGFTLASLLCGLATTPEMLVVARLIQGGMAALMVPQVMSLMQVMYKHEERTKVMGLFGMLGGLAATLGPIVGGLLINANIFGLDWRPIFLINLPIGIAALIAGIKYLPEGKSPHPLKLDVIGTGILVVALSLLIFPLIQGRELDWPTWILWMLAASVPTLAIFAWYERYKDRKDKSALVEPSLFRTHSYVSGLMVNFVLQAAMLGFFLTFTIVLQAGLGFSVINAALVGIPTAIGIGMSIALVGQKLVPLLGRYVISLGAVVAAIGFAITAWVINANGLDVPGWLFIPGLFLSGLGMGSIMGSIFSVMLQDVDTRHAGSASGVMSAMQQVSGALGVALVGLIFFGNLTTGASQAFDKITPQLDKELSALQLPTEARLAIMTGARDCFVDQSAQKEHDHLPASCQQMSANPTDGGEIAGKVVTAAKEANAANFASAYNAATVFSLGALALTFLLSFTLPRRFKATAGHA